MQTLTNEEKARSVLCRTGSVGNSVANLSSQEVDQLAAVYDECCAPEMLLADRIKSFWRERQDRLDEAKATDDAQPRKKKSSSPITRPPATSPEA
jgi:hypothetical protein